MVRAAWELDCRRQAWIQFINAIYPNSTSNSPTFRFAKRMGRPFLSDSFNVARGIAMWATRQQPFMLFNAQRRL